MAIETDAIRAELLDTDDFGKTATFNSNPVNGILDNGYKEIDGDNVGLESTAPSFLCRTIDVSAAVHGSSITIESIVYSIVGVQPGGEGMTILMLEAP